MEGEEDAPQEFFTVDKNLCVHCGTCVRDCPSGIIVMKGKDVPVCIPEMSDLGCIKCGHCVCICPQGAVKLAAFEEDQIVPTAPESAKATAEQLAVTIRERRTTRQFKAQPVPHETIELMLKRACQAPTAENRRGVHYDVVEDPALLQKIRDAVYASWKREVKTFPACEARKLPMLHAVEANPSLDLLFRGAKQLLLIHSEWDDEADPASDLLTDADVIAAAETIELVASTMGLGTCWAGFMMGSWDYDMETRQFFEDELGIGKKERLAALCLGFPVIKYKRHPLREEPYVNYH